MRRMLYPRFERLFRQLPDGVAVLSGSEAYPGIRGTVRLYQTAYGVITVAEVTGLPVGRGPCDGPVLGLHIHEGGACRGTERDPFAEARMHYNPGGCLHPFHAGDLPPLFSADGRGFLAVLTNRFTVEEVLGKTVILHSAPDDFTTQPAGNAGNRIACGEIRPVRR